MVPMTKQKKLRHLEYYDLQDTFDRLYQRSQNGAVFVNLMEIIRSDENIKLAYRNIKRNRGSNTPGTDEQDISDIEKLPVDRYVQLIQRKLAWYKPKPVKRVEIPKPGGKTRPLGIPTIIDRLVQQCILQVLEPICEAKFHERSNGFRPNRSAENALAQCYRMIQKQHLHFVVDIDLQGFFDNVNHSKLMRQLWSMGIRDKTLLCIIKEMLKAPIILPNGEKVIPDKGTPQGGILSPLLSNVVLNELDWWVSSQWESFQTHTPYIVGQDNRRNRGNIYRVIKRSGLKEMYIVRYADDFKIFCRSKDTADKVFLATKLWLKDRLKLDINEEKSRVVNLRNQYSEFLGFKLKAVKKGGKYVVKSHMSDKAVKAESQKLRERIIALQRPKSLLDEKRMLNLYNSTVWGIHNYYRFATHIAADCGIVIHNTTRIVMKNRLGKRLQKRGSTNNRYVLEHYGGSRCLRYLNGFPMCPISYIQTKAPLYKRKEICKYTPEGRTLIHENLKFDITVLLMLMRERHANRSIEFMDNRLSLWAAQYGKCAVTGKVLWIDEIHCHHKTPLAKGGTDRYQNLVIIHKDVHALIHATQPETISAYLNRIQPSQTMLKKINKLRIMVGNTAI
jgi:group II intron reverse transcriptase/maturase